MRSSGLSEFSLDVHVRRTRDISFVAPLYQGQCLHCMVGNILNKALFFDCFMSLTCIFRTILCTEGLVYNWSIRI